MSDFPRSNWWPEMAPARGMRQGFKVPLFGLGRVPCHRWSEKAVARFGMCKNGCLGLRLIPWTNRGNIVTRLKRDDV